MERLNYIARAVGRLTVTGAPEGYDAFIAAHAATALKGVVVFVVADDARAACAAEAARFFAPDLEVIEFPAWDCLPYDRVSPRPDIESARLASLARLSRIGDGNPALLVTTVNAFLQRVPPRAWVAEASFAARTGEDVDHEQLGRFLAANGYAKASTVREPGDFALRGGIVDLWPPGRSVPLRLDFFGAQLEAIRTFDADTQLSSSRIDAVELLPASEAPLDEVSIRRFRSGYVAQFGPAPDDPLYESVSAGRKSIGMEHWLALFHDHLDTLFDFLPARALLLLGHGMEEATAARLELIADYYETRRQFLREKTDTKAAAPPYKPLPPDRLYLSGEEWSAALGRHPVRELSPFQSPESKSVVDAGGRIGRDFAPERAQGRVNVFEAAVAQARTLQETGKRVLLAAWTEEIGRASCRERV